MPRRKRNYLPGLPYHVVQRGNNRERCFLDNADFVTYLDLWFEKSRWYGIDVHAYCLMSNHIHFLVTGEDDTGISNTMKVVGSRYAAYFNRRHGRTGTLWEGRHRSSLIDADNYLLNCYRYIEMNPVRAGIVKQARDYTWSSFASNTTARSSWLVPHASFLALGRDAPSRIAAYSALLEQPLSNTTLQLIRNAAHYCLPVGDDAFCERITTQFAIAPGHRRRGRPRNNPELVEI